ncbi:hypothetical protein BT67DRAFT_260732 [Trichocladium antarcticum]|uniref:Uncharacterized protein n=1 Tax=Trichocladium antarcticum TaxID=1450529 RepID=A0AAN6UN18_9PEZI|nr:hypothetical protein BT67DRAFT_260732 [Trichocladium antarcticum]
MPRPTTPNLGWVRPEPPAVAYRATLPNPRFGSFQQDACWGRTTAGKYLRSRPRPRRPNCALGTADVLFGHQSPCRRTANSPANAQDRHVSCMRC